MDAFADSKGDVEADRNVFYQHSHSMRLESEEKDHVHSDSEIYNTRFAGAGIQHEKQFIHSKKTKHRHESSHGENKSKWTFQSSQQIFQCIQTAVVKKSKQTTVSFILGVVVGISLTAMLFQHNFLMNGTRSKRQIIHDGFIQHTPLMEINRHIPLEDKIIFDPVADIDKEEDRIIEPPEEVRSPKFQTPNNIINKNEIRLGSKVYVGVITAEKFLPSRAFAVNTTWGSQVDKISFFTEKGSAEEYNIPVVNLEGVSDKEYPPQKKAFKMLKYMCEGFIDQYDWFIRADDDVYMRVEKLKQFLGQIDSNKLIYMGQPGHGVPEVRDRLGLNGHNFCMGGPSVIFNRKAMKNLCPHLDECMAEVVSGEEDVEIGRCVSKHLHIECTHAWETLKLFYHSYQEEYTEEKPFLGNLAENIHVDKAVTLHHIKLPYIMFKVHRHFMSLLLNSSTQAISYLRQQAHSLNSLLPYGKHRELSAEKIPPEPYKADKVSDVTVWNSFGVESLFSLSFVSPSDDITNDCLADLKQIGETAIDVAIDHGSSHLSYSHLAGGYYRSDPLRGTDYLLDIYFTSKESGKPDEVKRVHMLRPLSDGKIASVDKYGTAEEVISIYIVLALRQTAGAASDLEDYMRKYYEQAGSMNSMGQRSIIKTALIVAVYGGSNNDESRDSSSPTITDVVSWFRLKYPQSNIETIPRPGNNGKEGTLNEDAYSHNAAQAYTKGTLLAIKQWDTKGKGLIVLSSTNFTLSKSLLQTCTLRSLLKRSHEDQDEASNSESSLFYQPVPFTLFSSTESFQPDNMLTDEMGYWYLNNENHDGELNLPICGSLDDFISVTNYMQSDPNQNVIKMIYESVYDYKYFLQRVPDKNIISRHKR